MKAAGLQFDFGTCDLKAAPTGIELIGAAEDKAQLETLKDVVARHLVRFGANDQLRQHSLLVAGEAVGVGHAAVGCGR
jgi:hypothetical protein